MATGTFTRLSTTALQRSSHSLSIVGSKAYIFGGEIDPRRPVDNDIHVLDLENGSYERLVIPGAPEARVGHVAGVISGVVYVFGGRGGPAMTPLEESGAVHAFDPAARTWTTLRSPSPFPSARSYHCATATPTQLIIHGGCPAAGPRLTDVWAFDPACSQWASLPDAPGIGRGGSSLAYSQDTLFRFGGFNGTTEVGGQIDRLNLGTPGRAWTSAVFGTTDGKGRGEGAAELAADAAGPGPRSVTALHAIGPHIAVLFGEGKPSPTGGHDAAGNFWDDVWVYTPSNDTWARGQAEGEWPAPRGWFASDRSVDSVVLHGGLNGRNERLGDAWVFCLS